MSLNHIIESWRDEEYRESLDAETRSLLPESPAGEIELGEAELADVDGGAMTPTFTVTLPWSVTLPATVTVMVEE
jgi:mersacidin/lichenicidin family type 2 lantibiotic